MPIYTYKCIKCEHEFDKIVLKYDTEETQDCPKCGTVSKFYMPLGCRSKVRFLFNYMAPDAN